MDIDRAICFERMKKQRKKRHANAKTIIETVLFISMKSVVTTDKIITKIDIAQNVNRILNNVIFEGIFFGIRAINVEPTEYIQISIVPQQRIPIRVNTMLK